MSSHPLASFIYCPKCGGSFKENNSKSNQCDKCGFVYYFNISAAVAGFIFNEKGELLVCKRAKEPFVGTYDLPGGFVDTNEASEDALCREVLEELNVEVKSLKYLFSLPNVYPYSGFEVHTLDLFYECIVGNFSMLKPADDVAEIRFLPLEKISVEEFGLKSIREAVKQLLEDRN